MDPNTVPEPTEEFIEQNGGETLEEECEEELEQELASQARPIGRLTGMERQG